MAHTPGPWECDGSEIYCENLGISSVHRPKTDDEGGVMSNAEANANARLIAAAPELLHELKRLLQLWEEAIGYEDDYMDMGDAARAAIAKAEGRTDDQSGI